MFCNFKHSERRSAFWMPSCRRCRHAVAPLLLSRCTFSSCGRRHWLAAAVALLYRRRRRTVDAFDHKHLKLLFKTHPQSASATDRIPGLFGYTERTKRLLQSSKRFNASPEWSTMSEFDRIRIHLLARLDLNRLDPFAESPVPQSFVQNLTQEMGGMRCMKRIL
jgi:hypothetical protein